MTPMNHNKRPTVLVVDDTPDNLSLMAAMLEDYTVKVANNGEKALAIARSLPQPDLILLDIVMPGMDGYEVCRQLKEDPATSAIPVIFLTVRAETEDEEKGLALGAVDYITKPVSPPIVLARVRTHLNLKVVADFLRNQNDFLEAEVERRARQVVEANRFNQQIVSCAQEGIVVHDRNLRYLVWNPFMENLTGIPASEVMGKHPREIFPCLEENGVVSELEKALQGEAIPAGEYPFSVEATGRSGWTYNTTAPLRTTTGEIIGVIRTVSDISNLKIIEEQLRHAQKMEVVGQLAGGVAHDFNNILSVIIGYGEMLNMDTTLNDEQKERIEQILSAAERAAQLTSGLLTFSRREVSIRQLDNLNGIVQHCHKFLTRILGEDIHIGLSLNKEPLPVQVDRGQIEQVLINLATNARDAMPRGGLLSIETGFREVDRPIINAQGYVEPGFYACIEVSDTGCGMDQATRDKIFEPFFTTKEVGKGTGLGMSIIYGIVRQHRGFIIVDSEPGHGSTFGIYIPVAETKQDHREAPEAQAAPLRGSETILLAEDDASVRNLVANVLKMFGYDVISAMDGEDAVEKFAANRDRISLVLMDMIMPRKNGKESSEEICRLKPGIKTIYWSGYTTDSIKDHGIDEKKLNIIAKPVQPQELLRVVREVLDRGETGPA